MTLSETDRDFVSLREEAQAAEDGQAVMLVDPRAVIELIDDRRADLVRYALWTSPVWESGNSDDEEAAGAAVDAFLRGEERD